MEPAISEVNWNGDFSLHSTRLLKLILLSNEPSKLCSIAHNSGTKPRA